MKLPSLSDITDKAQNAFKRFPITILWSVFGSLFFIYQFEQNNSNPFDSNYNLSLTLLLGVSWLIGVQFFIEQFKNPKKWQFLKLIMLGLLFLFYLYIPSFENYNQNIEYIFRFFLYLIGGHLFTLFSPFITKWDKNAYWNYLRLTAIAIIRSLFFSFILYLGLSLALVAIDALFEITIRGKRYGQLFVFCLGVVNTWIYLSDFPKNIFKNTEIEFEKALEVLVKYILIPLVLLYIIILYAYTLKILIQWELPKGWVSYLVIALSILGYVIQVMINPFQKNIKSWTINKFQPWFYLLLIPLNILLFVAIFRRVNDYGITENRYFILAFAFWNIGIILYILFSKTKALKVIPISLFCIAILSSFGLWGAFSVSNNSQARQFENLFFKIKEDNNTATYDELDRLKSILKYLEKKKSVSILDKTTNLTLENYREEPINEKSEHGSLDNYKIWETLAIKLDSTSINKSNNNTKYYYLNNSSNLKHVEDISNFDEFIYLEYFNSEREITSNDLIVNLNMTEKEISIRLKNDTTVKIEIPLLDKLKELSKFSTNLNEASKEDLTIEVTSEELSAKMIFSNLSFNTEVNIIELTHIQAFLFIKKQ
ncbi:DUF4153 domain-containing protein [Cellulophaga sp. HaHaR_3_176]|uniref:DUF4153 domain-containing protein n=1 Tax=Cellulophaga sp. HaHaR_3_176 TaxID=1942464 RepID=UPI001C1FDE4B|nr:DUF4153 domain-containing protein [Cellulophaga sp. HaHaR_3_176]QWX83743.1 DUF4153 domain-containing protein [Cellulophaga sp. HaHaR_3_176]